MHEVSNKQFSLTRFFHLLYDRSPATNSLGDICKHIYLEPSDHNALASCVIYARAFLECVIIIMWLPNPNFQSRLIRYKLDWYCRTVHCFQNIWCSKRTHQNAYWLWTKCVLASDQSSVSSWLVQPIKELSVAGLCAGRGCALVRQLANCDVRFFRHTNTLTYLLTYLLTFHWL